MRRWITSQHGPSSSDADYPHFDASLTQGRRGLKWRSARPDARMSKPALSVASARDNGDNRGKNEKAIGGRIP
jgi:hypothetical protein